MASRDPRRPNVVFIVADDLGPWALGATGNPDVITPELDQMAAEGLRLSRFFCTSPVCSAARASLYTGQIPSRHGVHDWLGGGHIGESRIDYLAGQRLLTDALADRGYRCGLVGKWHLGANDVPRYGFVEWFAHQRGGGPYFNAPMVRDGVPFFQPGYLTYALTSKACEFVKREAAEDAPFFLALQYTAPHHPWAGNHPTELTDLYRDCAFTSCPPQPFHPWLNIHDGHPLAAEPDLHEVLIGYHAAVTGLDRGVGNLRAVLNDLGLTESTLLFFTSDNGFNLGHHGVWGKGNGTFPQNMYDSSVIVPAIFAQPGRVIPRRSSDRLLSAYDIFPTLLEYVGIADITDERSPGRSFAALLDGVDVGSSEISVVVFDEYGPVRMIRTRAWKYVSRWPNGPDELYDLIEDPDETDNLAYDPRHGQLVASLAAELDAWFDRYASTEHDGRSRPITGFGQFNRDSEPGAFGEPPMRNAWTLYKEN